MQNQEELAWRAAATAHILLARKKHGRSSKKSRSGCLTCKARRIKCDETHPRCQRCSTTARKCEYAQVKSSSSQSSMSGDVSSIAQPVPSSLVLKDGDRRTFDYFLSWTAPRLGGSLDTRFWCGQVLGECWYTFRPWTQFPCVQSFRVPPSDTLQH